MIRNDPEKVQHLVQHLAVLRRDANIHDAVSSALAQFADYGSQFDGFWTRAEHNYDFSHEILNRVKESVDKALSTLSNSNTFEGRNSH